MRHYSSCKGYSSVQDLCFNGTYFLKEKDTVSKYVKKIMILDGGKCCKVK